MAEQLYILGHPVAHSKSPAMHNAAYRALGLDWRYDFADCATEVDARALIEQPDWLAMNITMPYKPLAFELATWRSVSAQLAHGANVLVRRGDELRADNTDGKGCVSYLRRCGVTFEDARVVVCGTGPTSLSIMHAAAREGAGQVALLGRDEAKAFAALDSYRDRARASAVSPDGSRDRVRADAELDGRCSRAEAPDGPDGSRSYAEASAALEVRLCVGSYQLASDLIRDADVIIDATPLGMHAGDPAPFDTGLLMRGQVVFDVVYGHGETALVAAARAAGCVAYDGAGMLVAQAVETVRDIVDWLDVPVDPDSLDLFAIMSEAADFGL